MITNMWKETDHRTLAPLSVPGASSAGSIRVVSGSGFRYVVPFPYRLHEMLSDVDAKHDTSIVSWLPDGHHFKVHDPLRFVEEVIPSAFKQKSLKSFQRQLHLYGFQRVHEGVNKGAYYHEKFRRDDRDLSLSITRTKAPKRSRTASTTTLQKRAISQKVPPFQSRNKSTHAKVVNSNDLDTVVSRNFTMQSNVISPAIFDELFSLEQQQSTPAHDQHSNTNAPLHETNLQSKNSNDESSRINGDHGSSSSSSSYDQGYNSSLPQQRKSHQSLERSVADTCQWLINAGVPISAFDPVAIEDISDSTFFIPQISSSNRSSYPLPSSKESTTAGTSTVELSSFNEVMPSNKTEPLNFNDEGSNTGDMNSNLFAHTINPHSLQSTFQDLVSPICTDAFLTDLLPGENLPLVDDSLWAL